MLTYGFGGGGVDLSGISLRGYARVNSASAFGSPLRFAKTHGVGDWFDGGDSIDTGIPGFDATSSDITDPSNASDWWGGSGGAGSDPSSSNDWWGGNSIGSGTDPNLTDTSWTTELDPSAGSSDGSGLLGSILSGGTTALGEVLSVIDKGGFGSLGGILTGTTQTGTGAGSGTPKPTTGTSGSKTAAGAGGLAILALGALLLMGGSKRK